MTVNYVIATVGEFMLCTCHQIRMVRLFLQLIKKTLASFDRVPPLNYHKTLNSPTFLFPSLKIQKKNVTPLTCSVWNCSSPWSPPPSLQRYVSVCVCMGGGRGGKKLCLCCSFIFSILQKLNFCTYKDSGTEN